MKKKNIYLIAFYLQRPRDPRKTHIKGYIKDPANMVWDERIEVTHGLCSNDRSVAKVVLDLSEKIVVTNKFSEERDFDKLFKYFFEGYHKYITQVMGQIDPGYLGKIVDVLQAEIDQPDESTKVTE